MPPSEMRGFTPALERGIIDRVYLLHGDDDYRKEEALRALVDRCTEVATREFNLEVHRGGEVDAGALGLALDALPMMAERRVVVIRDIGGLKKDVRTALATYLRHPAPDLVLVLVAGAGWKVESDLVEDSTVIEFRALSDDRLRAWATQRAAAEGMSMTPAAIELVCSATGNDLALLAGELEKLRSYTGGSAVDEEAVSAVVGVRHGETLGDLLDSVADRDGARAIALLARVLAQPKTSGVSVVMALTTQTLAIGWGLAARARGLPQHQLEREFYALLKENPSALVGRPWGEAVKAWVRALPRWDDHGVGQSLHALLLADAALKDTRASTEEQILTSLVLSMTAGRARRAAA